MLKESQLKDSLHLRRLPRQDTLLLILAVGAESAKDVGSIKSLGRGAGLPEILAWNVSDVLRKAKGYAIRLPQGWVLTGRGRDRVANLGVIPTGKTPRAVNAVEDLRAAIRTIADKDTIEFLCEAVACFEAGYNKASVVLSWAGAVALLYRHVVDRHLGTFNSEAQKRFVAWKSAQTADDLARMKESEFLDVIAAPPLSIIGKNTKEELRNCLQLRNGCGHPASLRIGPNRVAAHLEMLILNVYSKFAVARAQSSVRI